MKLELAIVQDCTATGCRVQLLNDDLIHVDYSPLVQDRIPVRKQQLAAIDTAVTPPQLVWRWHRVQVHEKTPERTIARIGEVTLVDLIQNEALDVPPFAEGDEVWTSGTRGSDAMEAHALVQEDGKPTNPEQLLRHIQPIIEAIYSR